MRAAARARRIAALRTAARRTALRLRAAIGCSCPLGVAFADCARGVATAARSALTRRCACPYPPAQGIPCKFGFLCKRADCHFFHPTGTQSAAETLRALCAHLRGRACALLRAACACADASAFAPGRAFDLGGGGAARSNPALGDGERPRGPARALRTHAQPRRADGINLPDSPFGGAEEAEFEAMLDEQEAAAAKVLLLPASAAGWGLTRRVHAGHLVSRAPQLQLLQRLHPRCGKSGAPELRFMELTPGGSRSLHSGDVRGARNLRLHAGGLGYPGATLARGALARALTARLAQAAGDAEA